MYAECGNYCEVARRFGVSANTIKNIVKKDPAFSEKCAQKKDEQSRDALHYIESTVNGVKRFGDYLIDDRLNPLANKEELDKLNPRDLTVIYGTLIDKVLKARELAAKVRVDDSGAAINENLTKLLSQVMQPAPDRKLSTVDAEGDDG